MPLESHHFDLSPEEFGDALTLRYRKPLLDLPILLPLCDGCGAPFTVKHALDCHVGGLVGQRHNEVRDARDTVGDLAFLAWGQVTREPVVCESSNDPFSVIMIADLQVRDVCFVFSKGQKETKICRGLFGSSCMLYAIMLFH